MARDPASHLGPVEDSCGELAETAGNAAASGQVERAVERTDRAGRPHGRVAGRIRLGSLFERGIW